MGACESKRQILLLKQKGALKLSCPICQDFYDINKKQPLIICPYDHKICNQCLESMYQNSRIRKRGIKCPFCKQNVTESSIKFDGYLLQFLQKQQKILQKMNQNKRKLYAFAVVYTPQLATAIRQNRNIQNISLVRIRGKMLHEYQLFDMEMFHSLPSLQKLYLNNNQIKALNLLNYTNQKLIVLDMGNNSITSLNSFIYESNALKNLKRLSLKNNKMDSMNGIQFFAHLQYLDLSQNMIKTFTGLKNSNLQEINLQFNKIQDFTNFSQIYRLNILLLFGNKIKLDKFQVINNFKMTNLKLFSISFNANKLEDELIGFGLLKNVKWPKITMIIMQATNPNKLNDRYTIVQIRLKEYKIQRNSQQSIIQRISLKMKNQQQFGQFFPFIIDIQMLKDNYIFDSVTNQYIKNIEDNDKNLDRLFLKEIITASHKKKNYTQFKTKNLTQLIIGCCDASKNLKAIVELNFQKGRITLNGQYTYIDGYSSKLKEAHTQNGQSWIQIVIDWMQGAISWYVNEYLLGVCSLSNQMAIEGLLIFVDVLKKGSKVQAIIPCSE